MGWSEGVAGVLKGTFSEDGNTCIGAWVYPGGGGYESTMTMVP